MQENIFEKINKNKTVEMNSNGKPHLVFASASNSHMN
jgi:hypothetical protein